MKCKPLLAAVAVTLLLSTACERSDGAPGTRRFRDSALAFEYARFGRLQPPARGFPDSALIGTAEARLEIYNPVLPGPPGPYLGAVDRPTVTDSADRRAWLQAAFLSHEGRYYRYMPMDDGLLRALLATGRFQGACSGPGYKPCPDDGREVIRVSAIYQVTPGVARVFVARSSGDYAEETMYRLEQRGGTWVIVDQRTVMIT